MSCRRHRIDLNLLIDHIPEQFCKSVEEFITQIPEPEYLNLFITSLKDIDVTQTMYLTSQSSKVSFFKGNKLNIICNLIGSTLVANEQEIYNPCILTTDSKKDPPALEEAMIRIAFIKENQSIDAADAALKYLIFLVDVDRLYNVALGIYDFALVLMVAQHSQKDPREYLPFLGDLKKLEGNYRKFKIDDYLEKFEKALGHLSRCDGRDEEFLAYMSKHLLFKIGMELFEVKTSMYTEILIQFAVFQMAEKEYDQAGMLYEMAGKSDLAIENYAEALLWEKVLALCLHTQVDKLRYTERMVERLVEIRRFQDAASILLYHMNKIGDGIAMLMRGGFWDQAILIAREKGATDLIESTIRPGILLHAAYFLAESVEDMVTFEQQVLRLRQVRIEKLRVTGTNFD